MRCGEAVLGAVREREGVASNGHFVNAVSSDNLRSPLLRKTAFFRLERSSKLELLNRSCKVHSNIVQFEYLAMLQSLINDDGLAV